MSDFDYGKAEAALEDSGCTNPEEIYEYKSEKGFDDFMRSNGLNPNNYKTGNPNGNSSSGIEGCFLTTACVMAKHLPDDCEELITLRKYRDEYVKNLPNGKKEIDEYYTVAPKIVEQIMTYNNPLDFLFRIYDELVTPCVNMIKDGKNSEVFDLYKVYTLKLSQQLLDK